jgi:hypothetical protein
VAAAAATAAATVAPQPAMGRGGTSAAAAAPPLGAAASADGAAPAAPVGPYTHMTCRIITCHVTQILLATSYAAFSQCVDDMASTVSYL